MIKLYFYPTSIDVNSPYFSDYINGIMSIDEIKFWYTSIDVLFLEELNNEARWKYNTIETHKENSITTSNSLPLLLNTPELVYKISKRPITNMSLFINLLISQKKYIYVIPVTRYAFGMKKGMYYGRDNEPQNEQKYVGTFYYNEPESNTLLGYNTYYKSFNKYTAYEELLLIIKDKSNDIFEYYLKINQY